jgi:glycosyltransferase involved in cell wall biosynthesis
MLALATGLDRARYASAFVVAHEGRFADEARRHGFPVTVVDTRRLVSPGALAALVRHFRRTRPHLVHTAGARASFYGRLAARLAGVPAVVSSVHTSIADYEVAPWRRALYLALDRASARIAGRIIATSGAVAAALATHHRVPAAKIVTIPNRPDPRELVPARPRDETRSALGASGGALVGVVARLTEQKGVDDFLSALAVLRERSDWSAVVVGDGPLREELETQARHLGLEDRCRFAGMRTDLADVLAALDLLVVPSRSEGLPYLVLEAMLTATPIVATAVGGIPEVITDGVHGRLVPARAPEGLAEAIARALDDPAGARALADTARRHAAATLSHDRMLAEVDAVYRAVVAEAGAGGGGGAARPPCC